MGCSQYTSFCSLLSAANATTEQRVPAMSGRCVFAVFPAALRVSGNPASTYHQYILERNSLGWHFPLIQPV
jgi:hypothetical protein